MTLDTLTCILVKWWPLVRHLMVGGRAFVFTKKLRVKTQAGKLKSFCLIPLVWFCIWCDPTPLFWSTLGGSMLFAPPRLQSKDQIYQKIQGLAINPPLLDFTGPKEDLKKAATLTRECANVCLSLHNRSTKNLILKNITQVLKQFDLTSNFVGSNSGNMQPIWGLLHEVMVQDSCKAPHE